jgi:diaminopimelate decarboxylase
LTGLVIVTESSSVHDPGAAAARTVDARPQRHAPLSWPVADDALVIGGIALTRLAARVGRTPFFAYDRQRLSDRVDTLRRALPAEVAIHYAIKANPMPALV